MTGNEMMRRPHPRLVIEERVVGDQLQRHGGLYEPRDLVRRACGFEPSEGPLLDYLEAKFGEIYGV